MKNPLKDNSITLSKTLITYSLHLIFFIVLLPIVLICLYFNTLFLTKPQTQHHHVTTPPPYEVNNKYKVDNHSCDYFNGKWIHDKRGPLYNGTSCVIKKSHNCIINGRQDTNYLYYRWKPNECNLPRFEPNTFLNLSKNKHIAFIGDSLAKNQFESLLCMLSSASKPKPVPHNFAHWFHFHSHNATFSLYWSPFLVQGDERSKSREKFNTMHLDRINEKWAKDMDRMDLIVLSFGHWFMFPSIYYEGGSVLGCSNCHDFKFNYTNIGFYVPMRKALRTSLNSIIERKVGNKGSKQISVIMRTYSPSHFDGDWNKGGKCSKTEPYGNGEKKIGELEGEIRRIEIEEVENAKLKAKGLGEIRFEVLDITELTSLRPDGHPGPYVKPLLFAKGGLEYVQNDCVHWCLPGPTDTWNEIFLEIMKKWGEE